MNAPIAHNNRSDRPSARPSPPDASLLPSPMSLRRQPRQAFLAQPRSCADVHSSPLGLRDLRAGHQRLVRLSVVQTLPSATALVMLSPPGARIARRALDVLHSDETSICPITAFNFAAARETRMTLHHQGCLSSSALEITPPGTDAKTAIGCCHHMPGGVFVHVFPAPQAR